MATYRSLPKWPHDTPKKLPKQKVTKKETTTSRYKVVIYIGKINDLCNLPAHTIVKKLPEKKTPNKVRLPVAVKYGVATVSRIDKITGLFCRISSVL